MKMKFNFGLIKGRQVGFFIPKEEKMLFVHSQLNDVKQTKSELKFILDCGICITVPIDVFILLQIETENGIVCFKPSLKKNLISGYVGFSLFDTYGFPFELTDEILKEKGYTLDVDGFLVLRQLQKEKSQGTFKHTCFEN